jgi:primosomal protein N'
MSRADVDDSREVEEKGDVEDRSRSRHERQDNTPSLYKGLTPEQLEHVRLVQIDSVFTDQDFRSKRVH